MSRLPALYAKIFLIYATILKAAQYFYMRGHTDCPFINSGKSVLSVLEGGPIIHKFVSIDRGGIVSINFICQKFLDGVLKLHNKIFKQCDSQCLLIGKNH